MQEHSKAGKAWLLVLALAGCFALLAQFYISISSGISSLPETIIRFFSYFTIDTNILVAVCCISLISGSRSGFFSKPTTLTAVTVYILIVGVVYNILLRQIWNPKGLQQLVDELLHLVIPLLFLLYWLIFVPKAGLKWKNALPWMIYPFVYGVVVMIRGSKADFYPYPFFEIPTLGLSRVLINIAGFTIVFFLSSLLFVAVSKWMSRSGNK